MNRPTASYFQLSSPSDAYVPGDDKQLIDLDEVYRETNQSANNVMVQGIEAFSLGTFSRDLAVELNLPDSSKYDPFPSAHNSVLGAEGFFQTVYDGLEKFIEGIIKYIRMAFNWVVQGLKGFFGFKKSERVEKAINDALPSLNEEFQKTLLSLGFPVGDYNLEKFIGNLPKGVDRIDQLTLMRSKFDTDKGAIEAMVAGLPAIQQVIAKLSDTSSRTVKAFDQYRRVIKDEYNKTRVRSSNFDRIAGSESPEANRVFTAGLEALKALDTEALGNDVVKMLNALYKVEFSNDSLKDGFEKIRKELEDQVTTQTGKVAPGDMAEIMSTIQTLNAHYLKVADNSVNMTGVNFRDLANCIDKTDADKVKFISTYYKVDQPLIIYQQVSVAMRDFSTFCQMVTRQLTVVQRQINNLARWYARAHLWYMHALLNDLDTIQKINLESVKDGTGIHIDAAGNHTFKYEMIDDADAKTLLEKIAGTNRELIDADIAEIKTKYNNLVKQLGVGMTI